MKPLNKYAGIAGVLAGVALLLEFAFFISSGFTPDKVGDPAQAIALVQSEETLLRIATFFGFIGLPLTISKNVPQNYLILLSINPLFKSRTPFGRITCARGKNIVLFCMVSDNFVSYKLTEQLVPHQFVGTIRLCLV